MDDSSKKELYGLIGYPVKHSFSSFMHNAAFEHYGMNAEYVLFEIEPNGLEEFFTKTIHEKKIKGFNVTIPYKEASVAYLTGQISPLVRANGAVNTIRVEADGALSGFNTDGIGFLKDLKEKHVTIPGKKICLIGAGGAAKAVASVVASLEPDEIRIFDIDQKKAQNLVRILKNFYFKLNISAVTYMDEFIIDGPGILVNATPVGMKEDDPLLFKEEWLRPDIFVYDLIYNPQETKLLKTAKAKGCRCANGLGMLLYQGCLAFEHWTGKSAPVDLMRKALQERIYV